MRKKLVMAGAGELLWDVFPKHKRLGGAPANFACHAHQLGAEAYPISCLGKDALGAEALAQLESRGVSARYVSESATYPTGTVDVVLALGKPSYQIHEGMAWDHIPQSAELQSLAERLNVVCFGSLSQRSEASREAIRFILAHMPESSLKILDVNLRQSFYSKELIESSLEQVNVLKLSDEELPVLSELFGLEGDVRSQLSTLRDRFELQFIAYTRGSEGSLLMSADAEDDFYGYDAELVDSVGAGDSFTAAFSVAILNGLSLRQANRYANLVASYVCSQFGATPELLDDLIHFEQGVECGGCI